MFRFVRDDRGAVAVLTAILALVLIGVGALAVDLGNMYARKRMVQTQADLAALAGAAKLPDAAAARAEAVDYLEKNFVWGDTDSSAWNFDDTDLLNGMIEVSPDNTEITVTAPRAKVDFGLANVLDRNHGLVNARATAAIKSLKGMVLPFFVPDGCGIGFRYVKSGSQPPEPSPTYQTPQSASAPIPEQVNPLEISFGSTAKITIQGREFTTDTDPAMRVAFVRGTSVYFDDVQAGEVTEAPPLTPKSKMDPDSMTVDVPVEVASTVGVWQIQVLDHTDGYWTPGNKSIQITVENPADSPGCDQKQTGDFGLLDSPRARSDGTTEMTQLQDRMTLNIAKGLDHSVVLFPWKSGTYPLPPDTVADNCRQAPGNTAIPGGQLDEFPTREGANCMLIETGNKVDVTTDGLIFGGNTTDGSFKGRLDTPTHDGCSPTLGSEEMTVLGNANINADTLACYLKPGVTIQDLLESDPNVEEELISAKIIDSPRFFYVPVLNYVINPPSGFYPVVTFLGVFITGESGGAEHGHIDPAFESNHGLQTNDPANTKLASLRVVAFPLTKLPATIDKPGAETVEYIGVGPKTIRLIE